MLKQKNQPRSSSRMSEWRFLKIIVGNGLAMCSADLDKLLH